MPFTNDGKNEVRDLLKNDINHGTLGTGVTAALVTDSSLESSTAATSLTVTTTVADKQITVDYSLPATVGNGTAFAELGIFDSDNTMFSRNVFSSLTKSSTDQWQLSVIYRIV